MRRKRDVVNRPRHYTSSAVEPADAIRAWRLTFPLGSVVKYVARAEHKDAAIEDLRKALWYLTFELGSRGVPITTMVETIFAAAARFAIVSPRIRLGHLEVSRKLGSSKPTKRGKKA